MRLSRGSWVSLGIVLGILILFGTGVGYLWLGMSNSGGDGSMSVAVKLRPEVEAMPDPDSIPPGKEWAAAKCANGEWILGISRDSHGLYSGWFGGGTVVTKDSRGRVRCFFGHVCGRWDIELHGSAGSFDSLDEIDAVLAKCRIAEQPWP